MPVLKPGTRLKSAVCDTQVIVVKAPVGEQQLSCGGAPMMGMDETPAEGTALSADHSDGTLVGKRYVDNTDGCEFLCTKSGKGTLAMNGTPLKVKLAKSLPSSD